MKIKFLLTALLIASAIPAMAQSQKTAATLCKENPGWKRADCDRVKKGDVWVGMTVKMLLESQGPPTQVDRCNLIGCTFQVWTYVKQAGPGAAPKTTIFIGNGGRPIGPGSRVVAIDH